MDTVEERRIVAIRPRPAFRPLFEVATTRADRGIVLVGERDLENANQPPPDGLTQTVFANPGVGEASGPGLTWGARTFSCRVVLPSGTVVVPRAAGAAH